VFIKGNAYLRMVEAPERKGVFAKGCYVYEVMTALDSVQVVTAGQYMRRRRPEGIKHVTRPYRGYTQRAMKRRRNTF